VVLILNQDPCMANCNPNGVSRIFFFTLSWSANVNDMKSPRVCSHQVSGDSDLKNDWFGQNLCIPLY
jgi:hypothetical protein